MKTPHRLPALGCLAAAVLLPVALAAQPIDPSSVVVQPVEPINDTVLTTSGVIQDLYADPSDVVAFLDAAGPCGSRFFHVKRDQTNFREVTTLFFTGFTTGKTVTMWQLKRTGGTFADVVFMCAGDRNLITHASISR